MQWPAWGCKFFNLFHNIRIILQRRGMKGLDTGIDHQRPFTAPMPAAGLGLYAVDIRGRIGTGEGHPEEVIQRSGGETAVIADHDQRETVEAVPLPVKAAELVDNRIALPPALPGLRPLDGQNPRQTDISATEAGRKIQAGRNLGPAACDEPVRQRR